LRVSAEDSKAIDDSAVLLLLCCGTRGERAGEEGERDRESESEPKGVS
jgi:hypothetical protein